jgi:hypothetical protein
MRRALLSFALGALAACGGGDDGDDVELPDVAVGYMEVCNPDLEPACTDADNQCFEFNNKAPHCTIECDGDEDCAAPSDGCSGMGVCKAP